MKQCAQLIRAHFASTEFAEQLRAQLANANAIAEQCVQLAHVHCTSTEFAAKLRAQLDEHADGHTASPDVTRVYAHLVGDVAAKPPSEHAARLLSAITRAVRE